MDLKQEFESFQKMGFEEKRNLVISLLTPIRQDKELFEDLYQLIVSEYAIEQDFVDIYKSLMIVLYRQEQSDEQAALTKLNEVKTQLQEQKAKEAKEREESLKESENILTGMF